MSRSVSDDSHPVSAARAFALPALLAILILGNTYFALKTGRLETELIQLRANTKSDIARLEATSKIDAQVRERTVADVQKMLQATEAKSQQVAVQAGSTARQYVDQTAQKLSAEQKQELQTTSQQLQQSSQAAHQQIIAQIGEMRQSSSTNANQISGIASEVNIVKTAVATTKSDVDRLLAEMKSVRGDLGVQSGLIATNSSQLAALRALGDRDYLEFQLPKSKGPQRIGDVAVQLRKSDMKRNRFSIDLVANDKKLEKKDRSINEPVLLFDLVANDKKLEKKDRSINEPVQFYMAQARIPYEIVINEVRQDMIVGYLAVPKVKEPRK